MGLYLLGENRVSLLICRAVRLFSGHAAGKPSGQQTADYEVEDASATDIEARVLKKYNMGGGAEKHCTDTEREKPAGIDPLGFRCPSHRQSLC